MTFLHRILCFLRGRHSRPVQIGNVFVCRGCFGVWKAGE
jgi:hypothetical protein